MRAVTEQLASELAFTGRWQADRYGEKNLIMPNGHWLYGASQASSPFLRAGSGRVVR